MVCPILCIHRSVTLIQSIIDIHDAYVPLTYFNVVKLEKGRVFSYQLPGYETCIVPATGCVDVDVDNTGFVVKL